jgi:hypothetical protein
LNQKKTPILGYFDSSLLGRVPLDPEKARSLLPLDRPGSGLSQKQGITYGQYFDCIKAALSREDFMRLAWASGLQLKKALAGQDLETILIFSEKHGNLYHPAKIEVRTPLGTALFVMNVALSAAGNGILGSEFETLHYLGGTFPYPFLPRVYFLEQVPFPPEVGEGEAGMFLADWFEGYHEFHLSRDPSDGRVKPVLWNGEDPPPFLTGEEARQVYFQTARILTLYYNVLTYQQIFPWHHGAGDFVIRKGGPALEVKLITARQYGAMADPSDLPAEEALLFFYLNLSLRTRLDRLDGVGEVVWAGEDSLEGSLLGFLEALDIKSREEAWPERFLPEFLRKLRGLSLEALEERLSALLESSSPEAPDLPVIRRHFSEQVKDLGRILKEVSA